MIFLLKGSEKILYIEKLNKLRQRLAAKEIRGWVMGVMKLRLLGVYTLKIDFGGFHFSLLKYVNVTMPKHCLPVG